MAERDQNGQIPGDIQQARNTRVNGQQVTETTNAQGNRSFSGRGGVQSSAPKPQKPAAPVRTGTVIQQPGTAASGGGGGTGGMSDITSGLSPAIGGALTTETNQLQGRTQQPPVTATSAIKAAQQTGANLSGMADAAQQKENQPSLPVRAVSNYGKAGAQNLGLLKDLFSAGTAVPADWLRNTTVSALGGDPESVEGGSSKIANQAFGDLQQRLEGYDLDGKRKAALKVIGAKEANDSTATKAKTDTASTASTNTDTTATKKDTGNSEGGSSTTTTSTESGSTADSTDGITRGLNDQNNRSFSGSNIAEFTPNDTTTTMDMSGPGKVVNAAFERAIAAGDYETALQMANRSDASQMTRLGQLQGNIRSRREQELAARKAGGGIDQGVQQTAQRMLERAEYLAQNNSSKAAQRLSSEARALLGLGGGAGGAGAVPVSPLTEGIDTAASLAKQQAEADTAGLTAEQARTAQQQQQELQGILQGLNDPNLEPQQRQSLLQRYSAMQGGKNYIETERVVGFNGDGAPIMAKVQIDPITGQTMGGIDEYRSSLAAAMGGIQQNQDAAPGIANNFTNLWGRNLQIEEKK